MRSMFFGVLLSACAPAMDEMDTGAMATEKTIVCACNCGTKQTDLGHTDPTATTKSECVARNGVECLDDDGKVQELEDCHIRSIRSLETSESVEY